MKKTLIVASLVLLTLVSCFSADFPSPTPEKYVNDYVGILDRETVEKIVSLGRELEEKTTAQVAVVIVKSLGGMSVEEYANQLFRKWGIGQKDKNNGVLLLVAMEDRSVRIEVGYGLEGAIPDGKAGRILDQYVIPYFQKGEFSKGVYYGYLAIVAEVAKEYGVEISGTEKLPKSDPSWEILVPVIVFVAFVIFASVYGKRVRYVGPGGPRIPPGGFGGGYRGGSGGFGGGSSGGGGASRKW